MELEANLNEEGTDVYGEYTPLSARDILSKDVEELRLTVREMKEAAAAEQQDFLAAAGGWVLGGVFGGWHVDGVCACALSLCTVAKCV
jgi:hypothetical protein